MTAQKAIQWLDASKKEVWREPLLNVFVGLKTANFFAYNSDSGSHVYDFTSLRTKIES